METSLDIDPASDDSYRRAIGEAPGSLRAIAFRCNVWGAKKDRTLGYFDKFV